MDRAPLKIGTQDAPGAKILIAEGEIAYGEAPAFRNAIKAVLDQRPARLVIDLSGVDYMNTPGVATLVEALQISKRTNVKLVLISLTERVRAIFEIARLQSVFDIRADRAAGLS